MTVSKILADLVRLKSINPPGQEALVCRYLENFFKENQIEVKLQEAAPGRHNLLARLPGRSQNALLFTGHMDVVPVNPAEALRWNTDPFEPVIENGRLYGRGASDMKAGLAAILTVMAKLRAEGFIPEHDVILAATVDEEYFMKGSQRIMDENLLPEVCGIIVCEPTGLELCTSGRGRTFGTILFKGATAHGSRPGVGSNAIDLAVEFINDMKKTDFTSYASPEFGASFWQALSITAGVEPGVVPDQCTLGIDARLTIGHEPQDIWNETGRILDRLKKKHPQLEYEVTAADKREPWVTDPADPLVLQLMESLIASGTAIRFNTFSGTTDGTKLRRGGAPCVIIGPGDLSLVHRENESVALAEVEQAAVIYEHLIRNLKR